MKGKICAVCKTLETWMNFPICAVCCPFMMAIIDADTPEKAEKILKTLYQFVSPEVFLEKAR